MMDAWHFTSDTLRYGFPIPEPGYVLRHTGPLKPGLSGLHASLNIMDALEYADGPRLHRVRLGGEIIHDGDRMVAEERTIIWSINATKILSACARHWALEVAHLWDAPPKALEYLETGEKGLSRNARAAARAAIRAARKSKDSAMIIPLIAAHAALSATMAHDIEHEAHNIARAAAANAVVAIAENTASALPDDVSRFDEERRATYKAARDAAREQQEKHIVEMVLNLHRVRYAGRRPEQDRPQRPTQNGPVDESGIQCQTTPY